MLLMIWNDDEQALRDMDMPDGSVWVSARADLSKPRADVLKETMEPALAQLQLLVPKLKSRFDKPAE